MLDSPQLESALIVAPHADDEALGAGGLIHRLARRGGAVHVMFAAVDGMQHYGTDHHTSVEEREAEIQAAARILGFSYSIIYRGRGLIEKLDTIAQREMVDVFEQALNRLRPDLFVLPHGVDFDQDHRACFQAAFAAARPIPTSFGKFLPLRVISYEMPKLTWSEQAFQPNLYLNISDDIDTKLAAVKAYSSQLRATPHVRSLDNLRALAHLRGSEAGIQYAESFRIHRWVL